MALQRDLCITMLFALAITATFDVISGLRYIVGDSVWSIPPQPDFYTNWSSSHTFYIGDVLYFEFEYEFFNVIQVPRLDYEGCTALNPIRIFTRSPALAILSHEGHSPAPSPLPLPPPSLMPPLAPTLSRPNSAPEPSQAGWTNGSQPSMPNSSPLAPNDGRRKGLMSANSGTGMVVGLAFAICLGILFVLV